MMDPNAVTVYTCEIVAGGVLGPEFRVTAEDNPGAVLTGRNPGQAWSRGESGAWRKHPWDPGLAVAPGLGCGLPLQDCSS